MAIPWRAERDTTMAIGRTPDVVGPGAYGASRGGVSRAKPSFTGFASTSSRRPKDKRTTAHTPGPGAYSPPRTGLKDGSVGSGAFRSRSARMAPSFPGSTAFCAASNKDCPGPGAYRAKPGLRVDSKAHPGARQGPTTRPLNPARPETTPPTIPAKVHSYGYEEHKETRQLRRLPAPTEGFSGVGPDAVGPSAYDPKIDVTTRTRRAAAQVSFDKHGANLRADGWTSAVAENPGPGEYETAKSTIKVDNKNRSSFFAPKVNTKVKEPVLNAVGPGAYLGVEMYPNRLEGTLEEHRVQGFGSLANRKGWHRHKDTPFLDPSHLSAPGPGQYANPRSDFDFERPRKLTEEVVGFASSMKRPCLDRDAGLAHVAPPGPGQYSSSAHSMAEQQRRRVVGRNGVFGSTVQRFTKAGLPMDVVKANKIYAEQLPADTAPPPPESPSRHGGGGGGRSVGGSLSFSSRGGLAAPSRFGYASHHGSVRSDDLSSVAFLGAPPPKPEDAGKGQPPAPTSYVPQLADNVVKPREGRGGPAPCFKSSVTRFGQGTKLDGSKLPDTPGPGQYNAQPAKRVAVGAPRASADGTFARSQRFNEPDSGPPSHHKSGATSLLKKSFNISFTTNKPDPPVRHRRTLTLQQHHQHQKQLVVQQHLAMPDAVGEVPSTTTGLSFRQSHAELPP